MSKEALDAFFAKYPRTGAVSDEMVDAVSRVESAGNDYAVSSQGAIGPMQVIAGKQGLEPSDIANPAVNKQVGARMLDKLHKQFGGDEERMLRAYNQGPGNERKREGNAPKETKEYPGKVRASLAQWKKDHPVKSEWDDSSTPLPEGGALPGLDDFHKKYPLRDENPDKSVLGAKTLTRPTTEKTAIALGKERLTELDKKAGEWNKKGDVAYEEFKKTGKLGTPR